MDLVSRKKFLFRKYNNNMFSNEELDFFRKINATQIILLLKQNPHLRECPIFFEHTSIHEIEKVIASIFQPEESFIQSQVFNILVNILRNTTMLLQICFKNIDFNYMSIFGFLEQQHIDYPILILLEDVLLPYIRKSPFQIMDIMANDDSIEELMIKRIYEKPIFKIMYTVIFCLSRKYSQGYEDKVKNIIRNMVQTPFTYLLHKEKNSQQKISIICMDKTVLKREIEQKKQIKSSTQLPAIHTKRVREKKSTRSLRNSYQQFEEPTFVKKLSLGQKSKLLDISQSQRSTASPKAKRIRHQKSLQINLIQQDYQEQIRSMTSIDNFQPIVLNEDLDYGDLTFNMKELISDIAFNIKYVELKNVIYLLENINEAYIDALLLNCKRFISNDEYEGYCQGTICIMIEFGEMYKAAIKLQQENLSNSNCAMIITNLESQISLTTMILKLQKEIKIIASKIPMFCNCILENNEINGFYSSGQRIKRVGMTKFKILELINQLLQINSKNNPEKSFYLNLEINFSQFDLFLIAQKYLTSLKWNNIIHVLVTKIVKLTLQQDYSNFRRRYIQHLQKPKDGFLGTLMQLFRNKKFVFLKNMQFTNNGNLHAVYEITKLIVDSIKRNDDYQILIEKFPAFDTFVNKDLSTYEKNLQPDDISNIEELLSLDNVYNDIRVTVQTNQKPIATSMENAEELIHKIQNSKRWICPSWQNAQRKLSS